MISSRSGIAFFAALLASACTDYESNTNLNPEGPPMVMQVRLKEKYVNAMGAIVERLEPVFAFGTHQNVTSVDEAHDVTSATAIGNRLRIVMDELLVGNNLEEIACRIPVDADAYSAVPIGATPDDIARCATAKDVLAKTCPGSDPLSVCICQLDGGCLGGTDVVPKGSPVGVLDVNQDGSADDTRFIADAVQVKCGSIMVPTDINASYWNPSGDQNVPALGGFDALGPAVVLQVDKPPLAPIGTPAFFPTNLECSLVFSAAVVDKSGEKVCTPPAGDIATNCSPGDTAAFKFKVEPLRVTTSSFTDGATNISRTIPINLRATAPIDPATLDLAGLFQTGGIRMTPAPPAGTVITAPTADTLKITPPTTGGFAANTTYTIMITSALTDYYGQALPQPITLTFTTGM